MSGGAQLFSEAPTGTDLGQLTKSKCTPYLEKTLNLLQRSGMTAAALALGSMLTVAALPASAAGEATVTITNEQGAQALTAGGTTLSLTGSGFQSIKGGQGGIYVAFGWVNAEGGASWQPSAGGENGTDYRFAPDTEDVDNAGFLKFVSFPGGATSAAANGGLLEEDGTWATDLAIPAAEFESKDRDGNPTVVDCLEVQCGIVTIGAHNIKNANNETFTPIEFVSEYVAGTGAAGTDSDSADKSATDADGAGTDVADADEADAGAAEEPGAADAQDAQDNADSDGSAPEESDVEGSGDSGKDGSKLPIIFGSVGAVLVVGVVVARQVLRKRMAG